MMKKRKRREVERRRKPRPPMMGLAVIALADSRGLCCSCRWCAAVFGQVWSVR